jgi:uncharacterized protein
MKQHGPEYQNREQGMPYRNFGRYLRDTFGCRVYKVSVDAGFTCPNRDGTVGVGGCIYCNNDSFRPVSADRLKPVPQQVREGMDYLRRRFKAEKFIVYFQPYTNTHAPLKVLVPLYESALDHPDVIGLSIGTRPDCMDEEKIAWLERLAGHRSVTVEYGLQSINDSTLARINRGHTFQSWLDAMQRTRDRGIKLGTHLILGFPWESREDAVATARAVSGKGLSFLKLHHFHVVRNTEAARMHAERPFPLLLLEDYADLAVDFVERLSPEIYIERLFGTAPETELIAPLWMKSPSEIRRVIDHRFLDRDTWQGRLFSPGTGDGRPTTIDLYNIPVSTDPKSPAD